MNKVTWLTKGVKHLITRNKLRESVGSRNNPECTLLIGTLNEPIDDESLDHGQKRVSERKALERERETGAGERETHDDSYGSNEE